MKNCYSLFFTWILSLRIMWLNKEVMTQKKGEQDKKKIRYPPPTHMHNGRGSDQMKPFHLHGHEQNRIMCSVKWIKHRKISTEYFVLYLKLKNVYFRVLESRIVVTRVGDSIIEG